MICNRNIIKEQFFDKIAKNIGKEQFFDKIAKIKLIYFIL